MIYNILPYTHIEIAMAQSKLMMQIKHDIKEYCGKNRIKLSPIDNKILFVMPIDFVYSTNVEETGKR